jgi:hypothetical protein
MYAPTLTLTLTLNLPLILILGLLPNAKDLYSQAFKLNPEFLHLHTILVGIDKTVQMQTAGQKIADAQMAAKAYHYKLANHFYRLIGLRVGLRVG